MGQMDTGIVEVIKKIFLITGPEDLLNLKQVYLSEDLLQSNLLFTQQR